MAKINLLTIHYGRCYGAVMQTFATCRLLEEAGHKVTVINLIDPEEKNRLFSKKGLFDIIIEFKFWLFKKIYFPQMTQKCYNVSDVSLPYADYFVVGSDQVWNRDITGKFGNTFFLDFIPDNQKRISLSSSFGKSIWSENEEYTQTIKHLLQKFEVISIRESSGKDILKNVFNLEAINLLDPTLGYGKFDDFSTSMEKNEIYTFLLNSSSEAKSCVSAISKLTNTPVHKSSKLENRLFRGPIDWLRNIKSAKYIVTDSFHGLALSIIYHKDFFVLCADERKFTRLKSLLNLLGLDYRYVKNSDFVEKNASLLLSPIDYRSVDFILENEREKYKKFIKENII